MPKTEAYFASSNLTYLIISCFVFPLSTELSVFCFVLFLASRINLSDFKCGIYFKTCIVMAITFGAIALVLESRSHFYPVSYLDYAFVLITVNIISHNPLNFKSIRKICWVISQSPMVVFICYLPTFGLSNRNHWGFGNPNWLGLYCSMCLPLILCLLAQELTRIDSCRPEPAKLTVRVYVLVASLVSTCLMMVSSGSRSSFYTSLVVVILAVAQLFRGRLSRFCKQPKLIMYSSCFLLMSILTYKYLSLEVSFLSRLPDLANSTNLYRIKLYKCFFALSGQKPLWGWGIDRATVMCEQKLNARAGGVNHAHNFVLQLSADHGLIITLSVLAIIFSLLVIPSLVQIAKFDFNCNRDILHLGVFYSSLSILIVSLFQSGFYAYPLFPLWLGLLWGCQLNLIKRQQQLALEEQKTIVLPLSRHPCKQKR